MENGGGEVIREREGERGRQMGGRRRDRGTCPPHKVCWSFWWPQTIEGGLIIPRFRMDIFRGGDDIYVHYGTSYVQTSEIME